MAAKEYLPLQILALSLLTAGLFLPTLWSGFVYDARLQILTDPFIHTAANWWNVLSFRVLGMDVLDFNRPVHLAFLMFDSAVWGTNPIGYHLTSILLHAANTALLFLFIRALLFSGMPGRPGFPVIAVPFLCALFFGIHPIMTEAVCEPTYREDLLVAFFSLSALLLAVGHRDERRGPDLVRACLCAAACFLAVASKENGIAAPLLLLSFWILFRRKDRPAFWWRAVGLGFLLVAAFIGLRFSLEPAHSVIFEGKPDYPGGTVFSAMALMPQVLVLYLKNLVWPTALCADYGFLSVRHLPPLFCIILLAVLAALSAFACYRSRVLSFALLAVILPLLPVANLIPIYRVAADRYLYFPMVGISLALACLLGSTFLTKNRGAAIVAILALVSLLGLYARIHIDRQKVWSGSLALWQDTFQKSPNSVTAASGLGEAFWELGSLEASEIALRETCRLSGWEKADSIADLAAVLHQRGKEEEAARALDLALRLDPRLSDPDSRVRALALTAREADAIKQVLLLHPPGGAGAAPDLHPDLSTDQLPASPGQ